MLESILYPSKAIADQYINWNVVTKKGESLTGLIVEETATQVVLRDANGSDHRLAKDDAVDPMEIRGETFITVSRTAPTLRLAIENYVKEARLGLTPAHEVDNLAMAMSLVASTRGIALLPAYAKNFLPWSVTSRRLKGEAPTIDLVIGYSTANTSPILKLFLST